MPPRPLSLPPSIQHEVQGALDLARRDPARRSEILGSTAIGLAARSQDPAHRESARVLRAIAERLAQASLAAAMPGPATRDDFEEALDRIVAGLEKRNRVMNPMERVFIIEDTGEIQCAAENFVQYHTSLDVTMTALLKTTLRMRPDRILVGEVRGAEALDLLDAWNTGHEGGAATLHANDALSGLTRLESLISRNPSAPKEIMPLIAEAVDMVVHITRMPHGRQIQQIIEVQGFKRGSYQIKKL